METNEDMKMFLALRASVIAQLKAQVAKIPEPHAAIFSSASTGRTLSPVQVLKEIEANSELGRDLLRAAMTLAVVKNIPVP